MSSDRTPGHDPQREMISALMQVFAQLRHAERNNPNAGQLSLLATVAKHNGLRPSELAAELEQHASQVSRQLRTLQSEGLLELTTVPDDRRSSSITLTETGWQRIRELTEVGFQRFDRFVADWSESDLRTLTRLLTRLNNTVLAERDRKSKPADRGTDGSG